MKSVKKLFLLIALNAALFAAVHLLHFNLLHPKIIFRAGVIDVVLACLVGAWVAYAARMRDSLLLVSAFLISFFASLTYVALVPTMVDRSITVYTLMNLKDAGQAGVDESLLKARLKNNRIIDKRFEELMAMGVITEQNGRIYLSPQGRASATIFALDMQLLQLGEEYRQFLAGGQPDPAAP